MRTSFAMTLLAGALLGACMIESVTFTPFGDDGPEPDASLEEACNDDTRQEPEACDGADLGGADCTTAGAFTGGTLACSDDCLAFDTSGCEAAVTVPQLRKPINDSYVGVVAVPVSLRPTFVWEPATAVSGETITYELQYSTDATFVVGVTTVPTTMTSHQPATELGISSAVPVGARYYWRVRACAGAICSPNSSAWRVNLGRSDRDFNGDGFADLVVGAPVSELGGADAGAAFVYLTGAGGSFDSSSDGTLIGTAVGEGFGWSVSVAGDVNGDGFIDVVIGAPGANAYAGRVNVYLGGPGTTFDTTADGALTGAAADDFLGMSVASAGDVNGDGYADVIAGAGRSDAGGLNAGRAYVFLGGPGIAFDATADGTLTGAGAGDIFGGSVASAGDVNGDGFADVVVGASGSDAGGQDAGRAYVHFGGASGTFEANADGTLTGSSAGEQFGSSVASAGDVNGDGFADVVVGAYLYDFGGTDPGRAYVYFGGAGVMFDDTVEATLTGAAGDLLGYSVASAGDVNGDGYADIVIGSPGNDVVGADAGRASIYFGGAGGAFNTSVDGTLSGVASGDLFGGAVAFAGDVDGDGFADVVVGAKWFGAGDAGAAYVFFGGPGTTFSPTVDGYLNGSAGDQFGSSVASAADVGGHGLGRSRQVSHGYPGDPRQLQRRARRS